MNSMARIVLAAPKSGSGKTMITCGIIEALKRRKLNIAAMKCGPDYIDTMFHSTVLGVETGNLDTFFTDETAARYLLGSRAKDKDITVIEGVMGYYDGLGGESEIASTYEVARITKTPVVLVVDAKGSSVTLAAVIKGIIDYRADSNIKGVILNRVSAGYYDRIKAVIERTSNVSVLGFVPDLKGLEIPSRHLGLVAPEEMKRLHRDWINTVADVVISNVDVDRLIEIAYDAENIEADSVSKLPHVKADVRIAVARDEAFSFFYSENLELIKKLGAEVCFFSPLHDACLPKEISGLILWGGYPENYARELSENVSMRSEIKSAIENGIPCLAECGGFLYLQKSLEGTDGECYDMAGVLKGKGFKTDKLCRFGYMEAEANCDKPDDNLLMGNTCHLRGHEFHYWDCSENGSDFVAWKPGVSVEKGKAILLGKSEARTIYDCMVHTETMLAGFPHFYYYSNPEALYRFLKKCETLI